MNRQRLLRWLLIVALVLALALAADRVAYAITQSYKVLVGVGNVLFVREVDVTSVKVVSPTKVKVELASTTATEAGYVYTVTLFLDFEAVIPSQTVSFTAGEIPGTKKKLDFTGLSLGPVISIDAEVTR